MRRKLDTSINAGSMADIAFLLLLFFLVATTITDESGIYVRLPPFSTEPPVPISEERVITLKVNAGDQLLLEGEELTVEKLNGQLMDEINRLLSIGIQPILSLDVDRNTSYEVYISVYNEVKRTYRMLREDRAITDFNRSYEALLLEDQKRINELVPMIISEAEPIKF